MENRRFSRGNRNGGRSPRPDSGLKTGPRRSFSQQPRRRAFTGDYIDPSRFINKAAPIEASEEYVPHHQFADFQIRDVLKRAIAKRNFTNPTPIQDKSIPHILQGKDLIGLANTGTGKTGAFLVPMINKILENQHEKVLVVVPTRELAIQIQDEFIAFTQGMHINSVVVVGGANIRPQVDRLRSRHNIVIGTPGRLKDLIQRKDLNLSHFKNVILDEADRMLDMGFINDVRLLMSLVNKERQTLFFSATLGPDIEGLIHDFLKDPVRISIKTRETSKQVDQDIVRIGKDDNKGEVLTKLLAKTEFNKVLVFTRTKHGAEKLLKVLIHRGFKASSIHGNKSHAQRQRALKDFKDGRIEILVATDVAARGLDIPNVSHVINYDTPKTFDDYVHRIGRTGRADKTGIALTFVE
jgi:superfamily II DNA/RNA helicase